MTDMLARTVPEAGERERSFADEFDRLFALAVGVARARGFGESDARRVGVDVMARCYASWNRLGGEPSVEAWVQKTAHRVCTDLVRRGVQVRDDRAAVAEVLKALPRREREAAELCVLGDVAPAQAAVALGRPVAQVQAALDAARARLGDVGVPQPVAPVVVAVDPTTKADAIARGRSLKNARLTMRGAAAAMVVIVVAFTGWAVLGRSTNQQTLRGGPPTTASTTSAPTVSTSSVAPVGPPTTATGPDAAAPAIPSVPVNDDLLARPRNYFRVEVSPITIETIPPLAPPYNTVPIDVGTVWEVRVINVSGRVIEAGEFGDASCAVGVSNDSPDMGRASIAALSGPCATVLGRMAPNEERRGVTRYYAAVANGYGIMDVRNTERCERVADRGSLACDPVKK